MTGVVAERRPETCLERVLTTRLLEPHLGPPGVALDLDGGTGPYAVWLTELGWDVRGRPAGTFDLVIGLEPFHTVANASLARPGGLVALAVAPAFVAPGSLETVTVASTHGFVAGVEDSLETLRLARPDAYRDLLDRLVATADDPAILATSCHLLYVGRRPSR